MQSKYSVILCALLTAAVAASAQQSLADQARAATKNKPAEHAKKVFDNDNLPSSGGINVVGEAKPADSEAATAGTGDDGKKTDKESEADRQRAAEALKSKAADGKNEIAQIARELDVLQREWKLRQAAFYGDAGNQFRDQKRWADDERQYDQQIKDKQQALQNAKQRLDDLQEEARKAGLPSSATE